MPGLGDITGKDISSILLIAGQWQFFKEVEFASPVGLILGPGYYPWVEDVGIPNDSVLSIKVVVW